MIEVILNLVGITIWILVLAIFILEIKVESTARKLVREYGSAFLNKGV